MSTTLSLHHLVFNTYRRRMTIDSANEEHLYRYLWSICDSHGCRLVRIGGIANHVHMLVDVHPTVSLAGLVGELKRKSSLWMKRSALFPHFEGWGKEYFAFSVSATQKASVAQYIRNQKAHHSAVGYDDEIRGISLGEGLGWDDNKLT